jgi:hypothetical protein
MAVIGWGGGGGPRQRGDSAHARTWAMVKPQVHIGMP